MRDENEKKGLFGRLVGSKKVKKSSCCGSFELEEIPEEKDENTNPETPKDKKVNSCCK